MQYIEKEKYQQRLGKRQRTGKIFEIMCIISITIGIGMLALLLWYVADQGLH